MGMAMVHFTFVFPKEIPWDLWWFHLPHRKRIVLRERYAVPGLYAPVIIFAVLIFFFLPSEFYIQEMQRFEWGYLPVYETLHPFSYIAFLIFFLFLARGIYNIRNAYLGGSPTERKQVVLLVIGVSIALGYAFLVDSLLPFLGFYTPLIGSYPTFVSAIFTSYAVLKYRLLIQPVREMEVPSEMKYKLETARSYLVKEREKSIEIFLDFIFHGFHGLCITRRNPERVREKFERTPIVWLSRRRWDRHFSLFSLHDISITVSDFIKRERDTIVLLDGISYLCEHHGFPQVLKFLADLNEKVIVEDAILLVPLNPKTLSKKELAFLEGELEAIF
jgi:hypothetical protein